MLLCAVCAISLAGCAAPVVMDYPQHQSQVGEIPRSNLKIVLYSTSWCPHCRVTKEYFKKHNIAYINRDVEDDADAMETLVEKYKSRSVPVIVIGDDEKILKGFREDEFEKVYEEYRKIK
jgi:glutaredoxin-like YruB-family protein